jgi:hypothetical protein
MSVSKRRFLKLWALAIVPYWLASCATIPNYVDVQLPAYASAIFVECSSTNGALSFQLIREGSTIEAADLEWAAKPNGDWGLASYSPFGQTLFQITYSKADRSYDVTGRRGEWLNDVTINSEGILRYKGQKLGLKPEEFPCFFSGLAGTGWRTADPGEYSQARQLCALDLAISFDLEYLLGTKAGILANAESQGWKCSSDRRKFKRN